MPKKRSTRSGAADEVPPDVDPTFSPFTDALFYAEMVLGGVDDSIDAKLRTEVLADARRDGISPIEAAFGGLIDPKSHPNIDFVVAEGAFQACIVISSIAPSARRVYAVITTRRGVAIEQGYVDCIEGEWYYFVQRLRDRRLDRAVAFFIIELGPIASAPAPNDGDWHP